MTDLERPHKHEGPQDGRGPPIHASSPFHLKIDVEAERTSIRCSLMFKFRPLAGKGKAAEYGLPEWSDRAFRPIVEDLLFTVWRTPETLLQHRRTFRFNLCVISSAGSGISPVERDGESKKGGPRLK
jgi:hypothetical protein